MMLIVPARKAGSVLKQVFS